MDIRNDRRMEDDSTAVTDEAFDSEAMEWAGGDDIDDPAYWEVFEPDWDDYAQLSDFAGGYPWITSIEVTHPGSDSTEIRLHTHNEEDPLE